MSRLILLLLVALLGCSATAISAQQATPVPAGSVPEKYIEIREPRPGIFEMVEEKPTDDNGGITIWNDTTIAHRIEIYIGDQLLVRSSVNPNEDFYYALQTPGLYRIVCLTHNDSIDVEINF